MDTLFKCKKTVKIKKLKKSRGHVNVQLGDCEDVKKHRKFRRNYKNIDIIAPCNG
jgi:hypothetical protein